MVERRRRAITVYLVALVIIASVVWGIVDNSPSSAPNGDTALLGTSSSQTEGRLATDVLATLEVKGRAPKTGYSREMFGSGWGNVAGCDMRNLILERDLQEVRLDEDGCTVLGGILSTDPYTAKTITFQRGQGTSQAVQIDHVVAVSDAWQKGAQQLTSQRREEFYNDTLNLLAVDGPTNVQKGDADAATWLPPNKQYRCRYIARQIAVKSKYVLWVTPAERDAMMRVLQVCPGQVLPLVGS